jgi:biotin transport system permease protein
VAGRLKSAQPFRYKPGKTMLHRMPAGLKLIFVIIISYFAFASVYGLAASILLILIASVIARIPPYRLLKGSKPLVIISLCIILLKTIKPEEKGIATPFFTIPFINKEGFIDGLYTAPGLFVPFAAAALLFSVTTMKELRLSLATVEKRHTPFISLGISLMLGFIPRFFEMWEDANFACDSRSCKRGLRRLSILIPLVAERMMEASANTAMALEARGFGCG